MKETKWTHDLDSDIRLRKAMVAFGEWDMCEPDPHGYNDLIFARMRESTHFEWAGDAGETRLTEFMACVLDWQRGLTVEGRAEWLFDNEPATDAELREMFAQQVFDQPDAYWGEDMRGEAYTQAIENEYKAWVEAHRNDGILQRASDMGEGELNMLIHDRDDDGNLTKKTTDLLDAWLETASDGSVRPLFELLAEYHGLPAGAVRDKTADTAVLIDAKLRKLRTRHNGMTVILDTLAAHAA